MSELDTSKKTPQMVGLKHVKGVKKSSNSKKSKTGDYQKGRELAVQPKQEIKAFDLAELTVPVKTAAGGPTFTVVNAVVNGAELYQRTGRKIYMKSLHVRGEFVPTAGALNANAGSFRMLVVYDANPSGAAPVIGDVLKDSNAAAATTYDSSVNLINRQRFKILRDKWIYTAPQGNSTQPTVYGPSPNDCWIMNDFIKMKGLESVFNAVNGGTIADIATGAVFLIFVGDTAAANWSGVFTTRLRYYD